MVIFVKEQFEAWGRSQGRSEDAWGQQSGVVESTRGVNLQAIRQFGADKNAEISQYE